MGKKSVKTPDYSSLANASAEAARLSYNLGMEQINLTRSQYEELKPLYNRLVNSLIETQDQSNKQAQDYYSYWQNTYKPLEQKLIAEAEEYNTEAKREQLAQQAAADTAQAYKTMLDANRRSLASMGVNPNSGRFVSLQNQSALSLAAQRANAMTNARQVAEDTAYTRLVNAASLGRNLSSASTNAYSTGISAANVAGNYANVPTSTLLSGYNAGTSTIQSGLNTRVQGLSSMVSSQTSLYNSQMSNRYNLLGSGLGLLGGLFS